MISLRGTFFLAILLLITLLIFGVLGLHFGRATTRETLLDDQTLQAFPDLSIHTFKITEFGEDGKVSKQLTSRLVTHIPHDNQYFFVAPHVDFQNKAEHTYALVAQEAKTIQGFKEMVFMGQVSLDQVSAKDLEAFSLLTETLTYLPKQEQAYTQTPVEIKKMGQVVHANGMRANLKTNHITLDHAKATIQPPAHS